MTSLGVLQIVIFLGLILVCAKPLGAYMARVFEGQRTFMHPVLRWLEVLTYKAAGIREDVEQRWTHYTAALRIKPEDPETHAGLAAVLVLGYVFFGGGSTKPATNRPLAGGPAPAPPKTAGQPESSPDDSIYQPIVYPNTVPAVPEANPTHLNDMDLTARIPVLAAVALHPQNSVRDALKLLLDFSRNFRATLSMSW